MSIGRHAIYNLAGYVVPALLSLMTVPAYLRLLGAERFGAMTLAWLLLGYFGVFDFGLGRATAQRVAMLRKDGDTEPSQLVSSAVLTNLALGLPGALVLYLVAASLFGGAFRLEPGLRNEALAALPWLALAVPVATTTGVLSGALMGRERFAAINSASVVSTVLFQLVPLGVAFAHGPSLPAVLAAAVATRLFGLALLLRACTREFGRLSLARWDSARLRGLFAFGGWVTLASLIAPLLTLTDRFLVGTRLGAFAVTVYSVPVDITQRLGNVASAIGNALFPRLALATGEEARQLTRSGIAALYVLLTPPIAAAIVLADPLFRLWLGEDIGSLSAPLARVMLVAIWFNSFAQMAFVRLQAQGRPDLVAKLLLAETPLYLIALFWSLHHHGLWGASLAFLARMIVDALGMALLADRRMEHGCLLLPTLAVFVAFCFGLREMAPLAPGEALGWAMLAFAASACLCWRVLPARVRFQALGLFRREGR